MKIYFIRHAEPDYPNGCLTEQGKKELVALSKHYSNYHFDKVYSSPLERAYLTAKAVIKDESRIQVINELSELDPDTYLDGVKISNRDMPISEIEKNPLILKDKYLDEFPSTKKYYDSIITAFDKILEENGYKRNGLFYDVTDSNTKTIVIFSHLGNSSLCMSHLLNIDYVNFAVLTCAQPTGVTVFVSEEREKGRALFRMLEYGNVSHIRDEGMNPTFLGRFCEIFDSKDRH